MGKRFQWVGGRWLTKEDPWGGVGALVGWRKEILLASSAQRILLRTLALGWGNGAASCSGRAGRWSLQHSGVISGKL